MNDQDVLWKIIESWHKDIDLMYRGVDIADLMMYDLLRIVGNQIVIHKAERVKREQSPA
jgi:hypothetical protein